MADDLKVVLLSELTEVELESYVFEGRKLFSAQPGSSFSIHVSARDTTKFRNMLGSTNLRILLGVQIDGISVGYTQSLSLESGTKFSQMRTKAGCFKLKFKEADDDGIEDLEIMKVNAAKQWDSKVGTITVQWKLYSKGELIEVAGLEAAADPIAAPIVGATKKFWQRPSAAVELGEHIAQTSLYRFEKTFFGGAQFSGKSTIWFHTPIVFTVFQNLGTNGFASTVPLANQINGQTGNETQLSTPKRKVVEVIDLTGEDERPARSSLSPLFARHGLGVAPASCEVVTIL